MSRFVLAALALPLAGHGCVAGDTTTFAERALADDTTTTGDRDDHATTINGGQEDLVVCPGLQSDDFCDCDGGCGTFRCDCADAALCCERGYYYDYYYDYAWGEQHGGTSVDDTGPGELLNLCLPVVSLIGWIVFMCVYKSQVTNKRSPFQPAPGGVLPPLCGLFSDCHLCLHSCCCTPTRAADTFQTATGTNYYVVHCIFFGQWILTWILSTVAFVIGFIAAFSGGGNAAFYGPVLLVWILMAGFPALFFSSWRQQIHKDLGDGTNNYCMDCILYWWCLPCSVAQDAALVDASQGVAVKCCCSLASLGGAGGAPPPAIVGQPVVGVVVAPSS